MKKTLMAAATAALLGMGGAATAADIYSGGGLKDVPVYVPAPLWTGFYLGGHMGIAWSQLDLNRHDFSFCDYEGWCGGGSFGKGNLNSTNGFGGGQFGYNFQSTNFVYGIEVDLGAIALNNHNHRYSLTDGGPAYGVNLDANNDGGFYGDVTGRLGYTFGTALIYAKGGFAFLNTGTNQRETVFWWDGTSSSYNNNNNDNFVTGWTVGAGLEWKVSPSWSIKAEYLHFDFSNNNNNCCSDGYYNNGYNNNFRNNADLKADTVKLGFNYFWNTPLAPLK